MSFHIWLRQQHGREDAIGDLARDAAQDPVTADLATLTEWRGHLEAAGASHDALTTLDRAWAEWAGS